MTRSLRRTHLWMWMALTPIAIGVLIAALAARERARDALREPAPNGEHRR